MTLEYEICKQLKEIGLEQSGKCGWWIDKECSPQMDGKQGKSIAFSKHKYETNDEYYSVPQTDQLITWLEGKTGDSCIVVIKHIFAAQEWYVSYWKAPSVKTYSTTDKDLKTSLAKLCIELGRE